MHQTSPVRHKTRDAAVRGWHPNTSSRGLQGAPNESWLSKKCYLKNRLTFGYLDFPISLSLKSQSVAFLHLNLVLALLFCPKFLPLTCYNI